MWKRHEEIDKRISQILNESTELVKKYNDTLDLKFLIQLESLNKERDRLWKKEKKIQKELFGV